MQGYKTIEDLGNLNGKVVMLRADLNVPMDENFHVTNTARIDRTVPTIKLLMEKGAKVVVISHFGRPEGKGDVKNSLSHVAPELEKALGKHVVFVDDCIGEKVADAVKAMKADEVLLLENLRYYNEEKKGDEAWAAELVKPADVYVSDAFSTAHRAHASTALIAKYFPNDKMFGYLMEGEIKAIDNVLKNAQHPFTAIIGGSKVSSKLAVLENMLDKVDNLIIGGGMGYTFIKAQGGKIGNSLHEDELMPQALEILAKAKEKGVNIYLSTETVVADSFSNDANTKCVPSNDIPEGWEGMDAAGESLATWKKVILGSKTILWNGPVGVFEMPTFAKGTLQIAEDLAEATANGAYSLVGGGDSVAAVTQMGYANKVSYVSTGGGAMLEALEGKELPGIAAIRE